MSLTARLLPKDGGYTLKLLSSNKMRQSSDQINTDHHDNINLLSTKSFSMFFFFIITIMTTKRQEEIWYLSY
ncbi:hypothetical protein DPMN_117699 [Dreissena polymorpha]|uniref:Uncharacterized protein n=1 Tax=Dreissena polymorpha TaxID=45954 RepID=A0A9D4GG69_DREPO|nr:hypothetical protein DPMN_117699 [Dreissena polymorpha]